MLNVLPWHRKEWRRVTDAITRGRTPHAVLLAGPPGIGLAEFAMAMSARLLCREVSGDDVQCGRCKPCVLFGAGNHPDFVRLEPEAAGKPIKVDGVRDLIDFMHLRSQYGQYKIAMIHPADAMNRAAANTLLKTLEEPPPSALLLLCSHRFARLPATVRSRCQRIDLHRSDAAGTVAWLAGQIPAGAGVSAAELLEAASGTPLLALEILENDAVAQQRALVADLKDLRRHGADPVRIAERWVGSGAVEIAQWLLGFMAAVVRRRLEPQGTGTVKSSLHKDLQELADELDLVGLLACYDSALGAYTDMTGPFNLNKQGLLEEFAVRWRAAGEVMRPNTRYGGRQA